jgi:hypothetical protein
VKHTSRFFGMEKRERDEARINKGQASAMLSFLCWSLACGKSLWLVSFRRLMHSRMHQLAVNAAAQSAPAQDVALIVPDLQPFLAWSSISCQAVCLFVVCQSIDLFLAKLVGPACLACLCMCLHCTHCAHQCLLVCSLSATSGSHMQTI